MEKVSVLVPVYNEEDTVCETIKGIKRIPGIYEIIVVDDGSSDNTYNVLSKIGSIKLLRNEENKGKGAAVKKGLEHVHGDFVLLLDADLKESAEEAGKLLNKKAKNVMVIGSLQNSQNKNGFGITRKVAAAGFKMLGKEKCSSLLCGQRLIAADFIKSIELPDDYGLEFKLTLEALRSGLELIEVPVRMHHREYGRNLKGFFHRGKQCREIIKLIAREVANDYVFDRIRH